MSLSLDLCILYVCVCGLYVIEGVTQCHYLYVFYSHWFYFPKYEQSSSLV